MGTPDFAVPSLKTIIDKGHDVVLVVTSPDKTKGRGLKISSSAIKNFALENNLEVSTPNKLNDENFINLIKELQPDVICVVAFRILPESIFNIPKLGSFNLHGSLLPKYRGAAPINHAIINGESQTGVTTFFLKKNVDTGDIILSDTIQITENMTAGELHDKMKYFGANIVGDTLDLISNNKVNLVKQNDVKSSPAPKIFRENCLIKFDLICEDLHNFIRGLSPYPGAYFTYNSKPLKIIKTLKTDRKCLNGELKLIDGKLLLGSLTDALEVLELQPEGKKIMNANDFINGRFIN